MDGEVQVGVVAVNTSNGPHKVTFDEYSLKENDLEGGAFEKDRTAPPAF